MHALYYTGIHTYAHMSGLATCTTDSEINEFMFETRNLDMCGGMRSDVRHPERGR